jgi:metal-responsive CopG/Arc/MetJ family transcriptional regulator
MSNATTFVFDEQMTETLEQLKKATGSKSKAELIRRAVALYKVAQEAKQQNYRLIVQQEDADGNVTRERELVLP